jgi:glucose-6-phosphate 1-dehydrogenase
MQLLSLIAMEPPASLSSEDLGDAKVAVLRATRPADERARSCSIRGRYTAGEVKGKDVASYVDEAGVDPDKGTETFAQITFLVDTPRWQGVPFVLRSGKALAEERHDVVVHFRPVDGVRFDVDEDLAPNVLRFTVRPDGVALGLEMASKDEIFSFEHMDVSHLLGEPELTPYALLLRDILSGGSVLSVRDDEAEAAWGAIEPVLAAWDADEVPLVDYPAGSDGPALAEACFEAQRVPEVA